MIQLSSDQESALDKIMDWYKVGGQSFALGGYAGTGKSTLAKVIAEELDMSKVRFCSYTGKAANVLRERGNASANTLHKFLYKLTDPDYQAIQEMEVEIARAKEIGNFELYDALIEELAILRRKARKPRFMLNEESELKTSKLVIVDEFSMLPSNLITDLEKTANKILYLGDPFQLPPVEGKCPITPNIVLTEIHRQALESPIVRAADKVRRGGALELGDEGDFKFVSAADLNINDYLMHEQIIVGRNKTRHGWNSRFRDHYGHRNEKLPQPGEKMICLKNSPENDMFNGMVTFCQASRKGESEDCYMLDIVDVSGEKETHGLEVWIGDITGRAEDYDGYNKRMQALDRFDFGYAITCHKSQGSEFDSVAIYNEPVGREAEDRRRWLYTAITRGKNLVTLVKPKGE